MRSHQPVLFTTVVDNRDPDAPNGWVNRPSTGGYALCVHKVVIQCVVSTSLLIGAGTKRCIQRICDATSASSSSQGVFCR